MDSASKALEALETSLRDFVAWLRTSRTPGIIIGGVAASLLGRPRVTRDLDALVILEPEAWPEFLAKGKEHGFAPRISDAIAFAGRSRMLLLIHEPSQIAVDVSMGLLPFEEQAVTGARPVTV